jgi:predicted TIM-barrel fold metal-dependent hydrolase
MNSNRYLMISGDCHAGPPLPGFREYFDPSERDEFDAYCETRPNIAIAKAALAGDLDAVGLAIGRFMQATGATEAAATRFSERSAEMLRGLYDSDARNRCLDDEGIVAEVIFPDGFVINYPPYSDAMELAASPVLAKRFWPYEKRLAGARAYNRWLAEFCNESPERRAGVILLPPAHDVATIVAELQQWRRAGLRGGFLIPPLADGLPGYHDPRYDPIWSAAVDLGLPVSVHGGQTQVSDAIEVYGEVEPLASVLHFTESPLIERRPVTHFIWGGVFERFPELKLVYAEALSHWVPQMLHTLDEMYEMWNLAELRKKLSLRPSEYWRRNCFISASFLSRAEAEMRHEIHLPHMLWASDFPHPEGTAPYTDLCLRHALHGLPEDEVRQLLGENAFGLYDFDRAKLRTLADEIGPLPADVAQPPGKRPDDYLGMGLR